MKILLILIIEQLLCQLQICHSSSSYSNTYLDNCELTLYDHVNFTGDTSWGPWSCGDYTEENGDFTDNAIQSAILTSYNNFTCFAYLFSDSEFTGTVLLLNGTTIDPSSSSISNLSSGAVDTTVYYDNMEDYSIGYDVSSLLIRYQSFFCKVKFYTSDHQADQSGNTLGIGGIYTKYMLSAHGITDDAITSVSITGDDSCFVKFYSNDDCTDDSNYLMARVNGTGDFTLSELEAKGFVDNDLSCAIISANSGIKSLTYHTSRAAVKNQTLLVGSSDTIKNDADTTVTTTIELSTTETSSWSFGYTLDFSLGISDEVSASISLLDIVSVSDKVTYSFNFDFSWTTTYSGSTSTEFEQESTIEVTSYSDVICDLYFYKAELNVPYTAVFQEIDEYNMYYTSEVNGTYTTTSYYGDYIQCTELDTTTSSPDNSNSNETGSSSSGSVVSTIGEAVADGSETGNDDTSSSTNSDWVIWLIVGIAVSVILCTVTLGCLAYHYINTKHDWNEKLLQFKSTNNATSDTPYEKL